MSRTYTRDDVETHHGSDRPAVNVKIHNGPRDVFALFAKQETPDARFTPEWIEEHVDKQTLDTIFWLSCQYEFEYLDAWATGKEGDGLFADDNVSLEQDGRMGGWVVVRGLPEIEEWDAVRLARWRRFEKIAREMADDVPYQVLSSLYANEFEQWADAQEDASDANTEAPIDMAIAMA